MDYGISEPKKTENATQNPLKMDKYSEVMKFQDKESLLYLENISVIYKSVVYAKQWVSKQCT